MPGARGAPSAVLDRMISRKACVRIVVPPQAVAPVARVSLTIEEAAEACGVGTDTIRKHIRQGALHAKRAGPGTGGRFIVSPDALRAWYDALPDA